MSEANVSIIRGMYAERLRDIDTLLKSVSPDVVWETVGPPGAFPVFGRRTGIGAVAQFFEQVAEAGDFSVYEATSLHPSGDKVFALGRFSFLAKGTGKTANCRFAHVFTLADGKVVDFLELLDTHELVSAYR
jgi:ketosteroid isomerase-like protein